MTVNGTSGGISTFNSNVKVVSSSLLIFNGVTQKYSADLNGNVNQAGNLTITTGNIDQTESTGVVRFTSGLTGLNLLNTAVSKFAVSGSSGNITGTGTLVLSGTGSSSLASSLNVNGTSLDSTSATFALLATSTTVNVGTLSAGTFNVNSATQTFQGTGNFVQGTLQIGANSANQGVEATLSFWKKSTTTIGSQFLQDSTGATPNLILKVDNGSGTLVNVAKFSALNTTTNPSYLYGALNLQIVGTANGAGQFGIRTGVGGTTYSADLVLTNNVTGATNPNKYIRINPTGGLEVVNSAYNAILLQTTDAGVTSASPGSITTGYIGGWINATGGRMTIPTAQPATVGNGDIWVV